MNTISIILAENGDVARLLKDFDIYQESYNNKLIDIYVPQSILPPDITVVDPNSGTLITKGVAVYISSKQVSRSGVIKYSNKFNVPLVTQLVSDNDINVGDFASSGVKFSKFSMFLPKEFVAESGDVTLITNVVVVNIEGQQSTVDSVVTSQEAVMSVRPSKYLSQDAPIKATELDRINASINTLKNNKQDKVDPLVHGSQNILVDAVNQNTSFREEYVGVAAGLRTDINKNAKDIADLQDASFSGRHYVTTHTDNYLVDPSTPSGKQTLDNIVKQYEQGRAPQDGDYIEWVLKVAGTDKFKTYIIAYKSASGWQEPDLQAPLLKADNDRYGVIRGSFNSYNNVKADIQDGQIRDIYSKTKLFGGEESYKTIEQIADKLHQETEDIKSGVSPVGLANKAKADQLGNVIDTTYANLDNVYTKSQSDDKYLPITYSKTYYYTNPYSPDKEGLVDVLPTQTQPQFSITTTQILDNLVFDIYRNTVGKYTFTKDTVDRSAIWIGVQKSCYLQFRLSTRVVTSSGEKMLAADLSGDLQFVANQPRLITFDTSYELLGNESFEVPVGSRLYKKLEVIAPDSERYKVDVYCNETLTSTLKLVAQGITFNVNEISGMTKIALGYSDWMPVYQNDGSTIYHQYITREQHKQPPTTDYGIEVQVALTDHSYQRVEASPIIYNDGTIEIFAATPVTCWVLIWTAINKAKSGILTLTNPTILPTIDFNEVGGIKIEQTETQAAELSLPRPNDANTYYEIFVANDKKSTFPIVVNGVTIEAGKGLQYVWTGEWAVKLNPTMTSEIEDDINGQPLNTTLLDLEDYCNNLDATKADKDSVTQNATNISLLGANKQNATMEKVDGNFIGTTMEEFRTHFYELRKDPTRTWQYEVSSSSNIDLMDILTWPEGNGKSAFVYVTLPYSEAGGFEIALTYMGRNGFPIYKRTMSGTLNANWKDTGWYTLRPRWVDNVNGDVTLVDTTEISMDIGEFKNPYGNALIMEITKNAHSYNSFLLLDKASSQKGETTVKLDNEDVYISIDYDTKKFKISKNSQGTETVKLHIYEEV